MRPFILSAEVRRKIAEVKAYAQAHVLSMHDIMHAMGRRERSFANDEHRVVGIPIDFMAVYTLEQQPDPVGLCHHLSLRVMAPGRSPHPVAMEMLAKEFGIDVKLNGSPPEPQENLVKLWLDDFGAAHIMVKV